MVFDLDEWLESLDSEEYDNVRNNLTEVVKEICIKYKKRPIEIQDDEAQMKAVWIMAGFEVVK